MRSLTVSFALLVCVSACSTSVPAGEATVENASAAVVFLHEDVFETDRLVQRLTKAQEGEPRGVAGFIPGLRSVSRESGTITGQFFVQVIFQANATAADRMSFERRATDLGLESPIWLGPEDRWPFCDDTACGLVKDDGDFP